MVLNLTLGPVIHAWPFIIRNAVFNAFVVSLLAWAVMPVITKILHGWLQPSFRNQRNKLMSSTIPDLILHNGRITTLNPKYPEARSVAIKNGRIMAVDQAGPYEQGTQTTVIDLKGRRVIPGLNDSHLHVIRGGLNYNMELRWDGVPSLAGRDANAKGAGATHSRLANGCALLAAGASFSSPSGGCRRWTSLTRLRRRRLRLSSTCTAGRC